MAIIRHKRIVDGKITVFLANVSLLLDTSFANASEIAEQYPSDAEIHLSVNGFDVVFQPGDTPQIIREYYDMLLRPQRTVEDYREAEFDVTELDKNDWAEKEKVDLYDFCLDLALATNDISWAKEIHSRKKEVLENKNQF